MAQEQDQAIVRYTAPSDGRLVGLFVPLSFDEYAQHYPHDGRRSYLTDFDLPLQVLRVQGSPGDLGSKHVHRAHPPARAWPTAHKVMVCLAGRVRVALSESDGTPVGEAVLGPGDALLCTEGHEATYLEAGSRMMEVKQGPYPGSPDADRVVLP